MGEKVFKVVIITDEGDEKIHLKHFIDVVYPCFDQLKQKIVVRFPYLREKDTKVYWIDDDNDQVNIFNEEDFRVFVELSNINKDKLYVVERKKDPAKTVSFVPTSEKDAVKKTSVPINAEAASKPARPVHPEHVKVICDKCNGKIVGFRYKCMECLDFDLCMDCERKMEHKEHVMARFYFPAEFIDWENCKFDKFAKLFRHRGKHGRHHEIPITIEIEDGLDRERCHRRSHHGRGGRHHERYNVWMDMFRKFHDMANGEYGVDPEETKENVPQAEAGPPQPDAHGCRRHEKKEKCKRKRKDKETSTSETNKNSSTSTEEETSQAGFEILTNPPQFPVMDFFGFLNGLAKPLGVEVVKVDKPQKTDEQKHETPKDESPVVSETPPVDTTPKVVNIKINVEGREDEKVSVAEEATPIETQPTNTNNQSIDLNDSDKEWDVIDEENALENLEKRRLHDSPAHHSGAIPKQSPQSQSDELLSFMAAESIVSPPETTKPSAPATTSSPTTAEQAAQMNFAKLGADLQKHLAEVQDSNAFVTDDPRINQAVRAMTSMGFSNEGGWLTQLLYSVNGDIARAVDLMQPIKRQ